MWRNRTAAQVSSPTLINRNRRSSEPTTTTVIASQSSSTTTTKNFHWRRKSFAKKREKNSSPTSGTSTSRWYRFGIYSHPSPAPVPTILPRMKWNRHRKMRSSTCSSVPWRRFRSCRMEVTSRWDHPTGSRISTAVPPVRWTVFGISISFPF